MITCWGLHTCKHVNVVHCHVVLSNSSSIHIPDDEAVNWKSIPNSYFVILEIYSQKEVENLFPNMKNSPDKKLGIYSQSF